MESVSICGRGNWGGFKGEFGGVETWVEGRFRVRGLVSLGLSSTVFEAMRFRRGES